MSVNDVKNKSQSFVGESEQIARDIDVFLQATKAANPGRENLYLMHALIFPKTMSEGQIEKTNQGLVEVYQKNNFKVLGGDTSSGNELTVFISTIIT